MKNNLKNLFVILTSVMVLSLFFSILLYSTFCRLEQTIDWNAINSITNIIIAIITIGAVYVAIYIPKEDRIIASKIDLYQHRFQIYFAIEQSLMNVYLRGPGRKSTQEFEELVSSGKFLIRLCDMEKVEDLFDDVKKKYEEKGEGDKSLEDILPELRENFNIFSKYIYLSNYGIKEDE